MVISRPHYDWEQILSRGELRKSANGWMPENALELKEVFVPGDQIKSLVRSPGIPIRGWRFNNGKFNTHR